MSESTSPAPPNKKKTKPTFFRPQGGARTFNTGPRERQFALPIPARPSHASAEQNDDNFLIENSNTLSGRAVDINVDGTCPYHGWMLYFPHEAYDQQSNLVKWTEAFKTHIGKYPLLYKLHHIRSHLWFALHLQRLHIDQDFMRSWPKFSEHLYERTEDVLLCAGLAAHQRINEDLPPLSQSSQGPAAVSNSKLSLVTIRARLYGHSPITEIRQLNHKVYGKLVSVRGTVIRVNTPQIQCSWLVFRCSKCNGIQAIQSASGYRVMQPTSCKSDGCSARGNFQPVMDSPFSRSESYQIIRLQESVQNSRCSSGEIPKTVDVELAHDLVDTVCPGDDVTVTGIIQVKIMEGGGYGGANARLESMHQMFLQAISLLNNKNSLAARTSDLSPADLDIIEKIKVSCNPFRAFVQSLCTNIFGHEMVKAGLVLALFGGTGNGPRGDNTPPESGRRAETHVLVVGDPGVGKSHLLRACANISPKGVFVCGNSTTNAGLTVTVRHEKGVGGSLEAGALVLADQGVCCIDEFDKMSANYQSLLQVMEQQIVSVAKAGVLCALPARTCILAAANPSGGHYDKSKTVSENLKLNPALLSRFDLVFILLDRADVHLDHLLTAHIQALHCNRGPIVSPVRSFPATQGTSPQISSAFLCASQPNAAVDVNLPLLERLQLGTDELFTPIPHDIMQKYIGFARKNCYPVLSDAAAAELKAFYLELRATRLGIDSIPATTRQLEALIRLTQARARLDLCAEANVQHARDVLSIIRYSMVDVMSVDGATISMRRNINGAGMSQATQAKKFLQALQIRGKIVLTVDELKEVATGIGVQTNVMNLIDALNVQGFLLKKGNGIYKFVT